MPHAAMPVMHTVGGTVSRQSLCHARRLRTCTVQASSNARAIETIRYRKGAPADKQYIASSLWHESMNPLGLDTSRFLVAETEKGTCIGFGQLERKGERMYELRSIVIDRESRGKGIGSALVNQLLGSLQPGEEVWLTTIKSRIAFYERAGFSEIELNLSSLKNLPRWLWLEAAAGTVVARLAVGDQLCVMHKIV